jgi:hypothetical protein
MACGRYIETSRQVGYCFVAPVMPILARHTDADLDALIDPHRALIDGRGALEKAGADAHRERTGHVRSTPGPGQPRRLFPCRSRQRVPARVRGDARRPGTG